MNYKKILAFTLAEILITMSIVGAIAAITIPTLVNKRIQTERSAKLKKFYSKITNAVDQMVSDGNSFKYMSNPANNQLAFYNWYLANLDRYVGHALLVGNESSEESQYRYTVYFVDESSLTFTTNTSAGSCRFVRYDTNGKKSPNKINVDQYYFVFCFNNTSGNIDNNRNSYIGNADTFFGAYTFTNINAGTDDNTFIDFCQTPGTATNTIVQAQAKCTKWLQNNNWDYPANYPFK